ncbi:MAG: hypothetical protein HYS57_03070 [Parcubacteria group bacterium]|nr:hypothetical protein [Parcubacteria group bacterium]
MFKRHLREQFDGERVPGEILTQKAEEKDFFPFVKTIEGIPTFSVVAVPQTSDPNKRLDLHLDRPSWAHGRSFEVSEVKAIWQDEFGTLFGTVNIKGNNLMEEVRVEPDQYSPYGYKIHGLFTDEVSGRVVRASKFLRSAGVETEKIEQVIKPHEVVVGGERLTIAALKARLLEDTQRFIAVGGKFGGGMFDDRRELTPDDLPRIREFLEKTDPLFLVRSLQVNERVIDLTSLKHERECRMLLGKVFRFINTREKIEAEKEGRAARHFNANGNKDIKSFITNFLPRRLARNLAKIHSLGLQHGFPTAHNASLAGGFYDLDSIQGRALYPEDREITIADVQHNLARFAQNMSTLFTPTTLEKGIQVPWFKTEFGELHDQFFKAFYLEYFANFDIARYGIPLPSYRDIEQSFIEDGREGVREAVGRGEISFAELPEYIEEHVHEEDSGDLADVVYRDYVYRIATTFGQFLPIDLSTSDKIDRMKIFSWIEEYAKTIAPKLVEGQIRLSHEELLQQLIREK